MLTDVEVTEAASTAFEKVIVTSVAIPTSEAPSLGAVDETVSADAVVGVESPVGAGLQLGSMGEHAGFSDEPHAAASPTAAAATSERAKCDIFMGASGLLDAGYPASMLRIYGAVHPARRRKGPLTLIGRAGLSAASNSTRCGYSSTRTNRMS
jgi:hypothetical protein